MASWRVASETAIRPSARWKMRSAKTLVGGHVGGEVGLRKQPAGQVVDGGGEPGAARRIEQLAGVEDVGLRVDPAGHVVGNAVEQEQQSQARFGGEGIGHGAFVVQEGPRSSRKGNRRISDGAGLLAQVLESSSRGNSLLPRFSPAAGRRRSSRASMPQVSKRQTRAIGGAAVKWGTPLFYASFPTPGVFIPLSVTRTSDLYFNSW